MGFCIVCREPSAEGSKLCERHKSQAAMFSASFGQEVHEDEPGEHPRRDQAPKHELGVGTLNEQVDRGIGEMLGWATDTLRSEARWPKLVVYFLRGAVRVRHYYGVIPRSVRTSKNGSAYRMTDATVRRGIEPGGDIYRALMDLLASRRDEMKAGAIQMLAVSFRTYKNRITISERRQDRWTDLACFSVDGKSLAPVDLGD